MAIATIIGGAGRMGTWFASFLKGNGYQIIISDTDILASKKLARKKDFLFLEDSRLAVQPAQLVILATPTQVTKNLLENIGPHLPQRSLLIEISSVKEPIRKTLQRLKKKGVTILSIHPMFGPAIKSLAGKTIITTMIPGYNSTAKELLSLFQKKGARIIRSNFEQHDKFVSLTLSLPHFVNFAMAQTLKSHGIGPSKLRAVAGTTFNLQLFIAEALHQESLSNEASILMDSEYSLQVLKTFLKQSNRIMSMLASGTRTGLIRELIKGRSYLRRDRLFPDAYNRFNAAVEASSLG